MILEQESITSWNFTFTKTSIEGVIIVDVKTYVDERGFFMETYKKTDFVKGGISVDFVQDNLSVSTRGVLRGLHYQINHPQAKLVRVNSGLAFDVAVDIRKDSSTYGKWEGIELSGDNHRQLFIPKGLAHGFLVLSDTAEFCYKCDDLYHPNDEGGIRWDDPSIAIDWPIDKELKLILSDKDKNRPLFK